MCGATKLYSYFSPIGNRKISLPSFISHPNGILLRVLKRQRSMIETASLKKLSGPRFICHPNGVVLKVLNQKPCPRKKSTSSSSMEMALAMETEMEIAKATRCKPVLNQISISASSMVKMETETKKTETKKTESKKKTDQNGAKQRVKQLKRAKKCASNRKQHYSHAHHRPPQQQYKSKNWTIAIILKLTFVAWDSWTYQIGY